MAETPSTEASTKLTKDKSQIELPHCGVIMPISGTSEYPATHWADMLQLIQEAAKEAKFTCEIVSATGRDDIIHSSIVNNIYQNEIVVCDVSSRNPNVMLELGLRLASKLPIVIIFDGEGNYPFDIGTIRYLGYRRDMRYYDTNKFKKELASKIIEVYDTHKKGHYKSFLSHFKNVDFNLDNISTETQTLKEFMERIDQRLSGLEEKGSRADTSSRILSDNIILSDSVTRFLELESDNMKLISPLTRKESVDLFNAAIIKHPRAFNNTSVSSALEVIARVINTYLEKTGRSAPF